MLIPLLCLVAAAPVTSKTARVEKAGASSLTASFSDSDGEHRVVFTEHAQVTKKDQRSKRLTVRHEQRGDDRAAWALVWEAKDFVDDCEFDLTVAFVDASIAITDLDGDGRAEISFLYQLACRSDVSPLTLKLLMYEGTTKYALRGQSRVKVGEENGKDLEEGGSHEVDPAFAKAPPSFLAHATGQWARFVRR